MAWCATNGIDLSAIAATVADPKMDRRDIGEQAPANDGSLRVTRQARKHDLSFQSIPLPAANARAWEGLLAGEGQAYSFETSVFSSKGLPVVTSGPVVRSNTFAKFGSWSLKIPNGSQASVIGSGLTYAAMIAAWIKVDSGPWHHYALDSNGVSYIDGAVGGSGSNPFFGNLNMAGDEIDIIPTSGTNTYVDDLITFPFLWPSDWLAKVFASGVAFSSLPYLNFSGDLISEAATRVMAGTVNVAKTVRANATGLSGGASKTVQILQVDLKEV